MNLTVENNKHSGLLYHIIQLFANTSLLVLTKD